MHLDWQAYSEVVALRTAISEVLMTDLLWSQDATCPLTYFHLLNCYTHFHLSFGYLILLLLLRLAFDFCRRHVWWRLPFDSDLISDLINGWKLCDRRCRHPFIVRLESLAFGQFWQLNTFDASVMIWIDSLIFFGMTVGRFDDSCGRFVAACTTWWVASALHYILQTPDISSLRQAFQTPHYYALLLELCTLAYLAYLGLSRPCTSACRFWKGIK